MNIFVQLFFSFFTFTMCISRILLLNFVVTISHLVGIGLLPAVVDNTGMACSHNCLTVL